MTTLSGSAGLLSDGLTDCIRIEDTVVGVDFPIVSIRAGSTPGNGYMTFQKDGVDYQPPAGKRFIALVCELIGQGSPNTTCRIGHSTAGTNGVTGTAPTGFDQVYEIHGSPTNTLLQKQMLLDLSSDLGGYLTMFLDPGSGLSSATITGIEVDI